MLTILPVSIVLISSIKSTSSAHSTKYPIYYTEPKDRKLSPLQNYYSPAHCFKSSVDNKTVLVSYECETLDKTLDGTSPKTNTTNALESLPFNILWKYYKEYGSLELHKTGLCWTAKTHHYIKQSTLTLKPCLVDDKAQRFLFRDGSIKLMYSPELCITGKPSPVIDLCSVDENLAISKVIMIVVVFVCVVVLCVLPLTISLEYVLKHMFTTISSEQNRIN